MKLNSIGAQFAAGLLVLVFVATSFAQEVVPEAEGNQVKPETAGTLIQPEKQPDLTTPPQPDTSAGQPQSTADSQPSLSDGVINDEQPKDTELEGNVDSVPVNPADSQPAVVSVQDTPDSVLTLPSVQPLLPMAALSPAVGQAIDCQWSMLPATPISALPPANVGIATPSNNPCGCCQPNYVCPSCCPSFGSSSSWISRRTRRTPCRTRWFRCGFGCR